MSEDTEAAIQRLDNELSKSMPGWLAERVAEAVEMLIESKLADFMELAADRAHAALSKAQGD